MNETVEISSDSDNDQPSYSNSRSAPQSPQTGKKSSKGDITDIVSKYIFENSSPVHEYLDLDLDTDMHPVESPKTTYLHVSSDIDNESRSTMISPLNFPSEYKAIEDVYKEFNLPEKSPCRRISLSSSSSESDTPKAKALTARERKRLEKEAKTKERQEQKLQKQNEKERDKALKKVLSDQNKNIKPEECMKFITAHLDQDLLSEDYGKGIATALDLAEIKYKLIHQVSPGVITWTRRNQSSSMSDDGNLALSSQEVHTDEAIIIMNYVDVVLQINENTLDEHIQSVKSILNKKIIFLAVVGLGAYFKYLRNHHKNELRSELASENEAPRQVKASKKMSSLPKVNRKRIEENLTRLQLFWGCSHRVVETDADLENLIVQFSKSIAQLPYKNKKKSTLEQTDWFSGGENKDTVKVDKNGNGLGRLWSKVLTTFPLASLETSEAISSNYSTPTRLMEAYDRCSSQVEGEQLLQDIQIRRAAGPLTASRRIGPELSKKIYHFFNSTDGNQVL